MRLFLLKSEDKLDSSYVSDTVFQEETKILCKTSLLFGVFSGNENCCVNVEIVKILIKIGQIEIAFCFDKNLGK